MGMGFNMQFGGVIGFLVLIGVIWAIVSTFGSNATTGTKVFWIAFLLILPPIGLIVWFFAGPRSSR